MGEGEFMSSYRRMRASVVTWNSIDTRCYERRRITRPPPHRRITRPPPHRQATPCRWSSPTDPPTAESDALNVGDQTNISWPEYSCPSGTEVAGYQVEVAPTTVGAWLDQNPTAADTTSGTIEALAPGSMNVRYQVFCGLNESGYSEGLWISVEAPPTVDGGGEVHGGPGGDMPIDPRERFRAASARFTAPIKSTEI
jgi:hypothetical protein